jgi:hypothetical protein
MWGVCDRRDYSVHSGYAMWLLLGLSCACGEAEVHSNGTAETLRDNAVRSLLLKSVLPDVTMLLSTLKTELQDRLQDP